MKKKIPDSLVVPGHKDYEILSNIKRDLEERAGGAERLREIVPPMFRREIDSIIKTAQTGRRSFGQLEKTERTYIGTLVEIMLRSELSLPRGRLDTRLCGHDVDIKHTMASDWMIPKEAFGHPCILCAADEKSALCYMGLVVARPEYLRTGKNRDKKTSLIASEWENILWIFCAEPYPKNFWRDLDEKTVDHIFDHKSGNERVRRLFHAVRGEVVTREAVEGVAQQKDPLRRLRADKGNGTRDRLAKDGILLLSKEFHKDLMEELNLPVGDFVSYAPKTEREKDLARKAKLKI